MGIYNHGTQDITYNYYEEATAEGFNKRHLDIRSRGIYKGGYLTKVSDSKVTLSPFTLEIGDGDEQISSKSSGYATLEGGGPGESKLDSGSISSATPYIVLRWAFAEQSDNYVEVHAIASVAAALTNDIIVGKCVFIGAVLQTTFDYSSRTFLNVQDLFLKVEATIVTEMYTRIRAGRIQNGNTSISIKNQKVGSFAVPSSPNSRIDLVYVTSAGVVSIQQGSPSPSPTIPNYEGRLVVAEVRLVNGDSNILASRITDVRSFVFPQQFVIGKRTSDPSFPTAGQIWFRTDL